MSSTCLYSARPQWVSWPSYIVFRGIWLTGLSLSVLFIKNNIESSQGITACDVNMKHQLCVAQMPWEVSESLWNFHFRIQNFKQIPFSCIYTTLHSIAVIQALGIRPANVQYKLTFSIPRTCTTCVFWTIPISIPYPLSKWIHSHLLFFFLYCFLMPWPLSGRQLCCSTNIFLCCETTVKSSDHFA